MCTWHGHTDTSTVTITHANTRAAPPAGLQDPPHTSHPHACSQPCPHEDAKSPPPDLYCPPPVTITPPTRKMQREHAEGAAAAAATAASPAPSRAHAHARPRPTRAAPTRAPRPPGPALTSHRPPGGRGCPRWGRGPLCAGEGRVRRERGRRPGSRRPTRWGGGGARDGLDGRAVTAAGTAPSAAAPAAAAVARAPPPLLGDRCCRGRLCHEPRRPETTRERRGRGTEGPPKPTRPPIIAS